MDFKFPWEQSEEEQKVAQKAAQFQQKQEAAGMPKAPEEEGLEEGDITDYTAPFGLVRNIAKSGIKMAAKEAESLAARKAKALAAEKAHEAIAKEQARWRPAKTIQQPSDFSKAELMKREEAKNAVTAFFKKNK